MESSTGQAGADSGGFDFLPLEAWVRIQTKSKHGHHYRTADEACQGYTQTQQEVLELWHGKVVRAGDVVLDIGCGNGRTALFAQSLPISRFIGIDPLKPSIKFCRKAFRSDPRFTFEHIDLHNPQYNPRGRVRPESFTLDLASTSVDVVLCFSLFTHLENEATADRYMSEIRRVLKPGGRLFASWFRSPPNSLSTSAFRTVYQESTIRPMYSGFEILTERGGQTTDMNDQWCLIAERKSTNQAS